MTRDDLAERKAALRAWAQKRRHAQHDKDAVSRAILQRAMELPEHRRAHCVLCYVDVRSEVRTRASIPEMLAAGKEVVVPWCDGPELALFHLESLNELSPGAFGVLEPRLDLRQQPERRVAPVHLDLVFVPGVAFDRQGGRLGHGAGYYDRLLARVGSDTALIGLAFQCQLADAVPRNAHDIPMDAIVTERAVYRTSAAPRSGL